MFLQIASTVVELIQLSRRSASDKDLESLLLRRQLAILERKNRQPIRLSRGEKLTLVVLAVRLKATTGRTIHGILHARTSLRHCCDIWYSYLNKFPGQTMNEKEETRIILAAIQRENNKLQQTIDHPPLIYRNYILGQPWPLHNVSVVGTGGEGEINLNVSYNFPRIPHGGTLQDVLFEEWQGFPTSHQILTEIRQLNISVLEAEDLTNEPPAPMTTEEQLLELMKQGGMKGTDAPRVKIVQTPDAIDIHAAEPSDGQEKGEEPSDESGL